MRDEAAVPKRVQRAANGRRRPEMGQPQAEPARQRRQRQRQHETIVEAIGESKVDERRQEQVIVPVGLEEVKSGLQVSELDAEHQAPEIEHVIEGEA